MKRIILFCVLLLLCGCYTFEPSAPEPAVPAGPWEYNGIEIQRHDEIYGYDALTPDGQKAFDLLYGEYFSQDIMRRKSDYFEFELPVPISYEEYRNVLFLYQAATARYSTSIFAYSSEDRPTDSSTCTVYTMYAYGHSSGNPEVDAQFFETQEKASQIISEMPSGLPDREKLRYMAAYLAEKVEYFTLGGFGFGTYGEITYPSAYGALIEGKANCSGYASAFAALAYEAGFNCIVVEGYAKNAVDGGEHKWNMVKLDGRWYHIDPTWIDSADGFDDGYFLVNDEQISKTHRALRYAGEQFVSPPVAE